MPILGGGGGKNGVHTFKCIFIKCRKPQNTVELLTRYMIFSQKFVTFCFSVTFHQLNSCTAFSLQNQSTLAFKMKILVFMLVNNTAFM